MNNGQHASQNQVTRRSLPGYGACANAGNHGIRGIGCSKPVLALCLLVLLVLAGCQQPFTTHGGGLTVFLDGAGHWGNGGDDVKRGLHAAGYTGSFREFVWTTTYSPLLDQWNTGAARRRARQLARQLVRFRRRHPDEPINLIAHSAGTGVAVWAVEQLPEDMTVSNLILLGSSLSHDYDVSAVLRKMTGRLYVYYSPHDTVLQKVRVIGTIDGRRGVDSIGLVGLTPPTGQAERVVNVAWSRQWLRLGWAGAHTDCTNPQFARAAIARHILDEGGRSGAQNSSAEMPLRVNPIAPAPQQAVLVSTDRAKARSSHTAG